MKFWGYIKMTLEEFDKHLDSYLKITEKDLTQQLFFWQFRLCYSGEDADFLKIYKYYKENSKHFKCKQLTMEGI